MADLILGYVCGDNNELFCKHILIFVVFSELVYLTTRAEILGGTPLMAPSNGSGMAQVDFDPNTLELSWQLSFMELSSPTTEANFHGPAGLLETAGVQVKYCCCLEFGLTFRSFNY